MEDPSDLEEQKVPVIEEELVTGTRAVRTGSVRVRKQVEQVRKEIDLPAMLDVVSVNRVHMNRVVGSVPDIRHEGIPRLFPSSKKRLSSRSGLC